ncbi:MAG: GC-type dockerin domain-anchored protein [Phycisphaerales bacterium JB040]
MPGLRLCCALTMASAAHAANGQDLLYAVTNTDLIVISLDEPGSVQTIGPHGLSFVTLQGGDTRGPFSLTYDRGSDRLLGLHYQFLQETGGFLQTLVEYDFQTGEASTLSVIAQSGVDGFVECIEYVDELDAIVVSRDLDGAITTSLETVNPDGTTTPLTDTGTDNDFAVYDQTRGRFYVMDPNGDEELRLADLNDGSVTPVTPVLSSTGDLAYSAERDTIYSYVYGPNALVSLGDGLREQNPIPIGIVGLPGPVLGLAIVPEDRDPGCLSDLDGDNVLSTTDIQIMVQLFQSGDIQADFTGDGVLDLSDLQEFVRIFLTGCA